jgi:acyl dehydratase
MLKFGDSEVFEGEKMTVKGHQNRGLFFEDYSTGQRIITAGRTITESDIVNFAGLSGDYNQIHTDLEYSSKTPFGQRVAHGLLGMAVCSGLAAQTGVMEGTVLAFREIRDWKFIKPILINDTIHAELTVKAKKAMPRIGGGAIDIDVYLKNQEQETLMRGTWVVLIASGN